MKKTKNTSLRAGAAKVDISPAKGIQLAGDIGRRRPCTGIADPIYARALVLEKNGKQCCVLSLDVLAIDTPWADELRRRAQARYRFPPEAVVIHTTQNHAAPSIGNHFCRDSCTRIPDRYAYLRGGDARYNEPAVAGILEAMGKALANLEPVAVSVGRAIDGRIATNRRYVMRDGTSRCQPGAGNPNVLHVEGPTDPEVGVVTFTGAKGRTISALLHHTAHPCNGFWGSKVLPDWPGAWCQGMEAHFGKTCTPLVINGCCGNIITFDYLNPAQKNDGDYRRYGRLLTESTMRALKDMRPVKGTAFGWASRILPIPKRVIPRQALAEARSMLKEHPGPLWKDPKHNRVEWDWVYNVGIVDMADEDRTQPDFPYEIQALRIGDFGLLAIMGEPFVEAQLNIKLKSPFPFLQVAHLCNGYCCYVPTRRALAGGGYETRIGWGSRLAPEALEMIEKASVQLLKKLAAHPSSSA